MARVVSSFPRKDRSKYPWSQWFDGQVWELEKGADFDCTPTSVRTSALSAAFRRGIKVRTSQMGNKVFVQAQIKSGSVKSDSTSNRLAAVSVDGKGVS